MAAPECSYKGRHLSVLSVQRAVPQKATAGASLMRRNFLKARFQEKLAFGAGFYGSVQSLQKQKFQTAWGKGRCAQIFKGGTTKNGEERQDQFPLGRYHWMREGVRVVQSPSLRIPLVRGESQVPS